MTVAEDVLAKYLGPDLLDGRVGEELKRPGNRVGRDAMTLKANVLHLENFLRRLEAQVRFRVEVLLRRLLGLLGEVLRKWMARTGHGLGCRTDDMGCRGRLGDECTRHFVSRSYDSEIRVQ